MTADFFSTRWQRGRTKASLTLADNQTLHLQQTPTGGWEVTPDLGEDVREALRATTGRDAAVAVVERVISLPQWTRTEKGWTLGPWEVIAEGTRYALLRNGQPTTRWSFPTADQARGWAEARLHRSSRSFFGRNLRAEGKSLVCLPVVRVTAEEKEAVMAVIQHHGITYAEFVRTAAQFFHSANHVSLIKEGGQLRFQMAR